MEKNQHDPHRHGRHAHGAHGDDDRHGARQPERFDQRGFCAARSKWIAASVSV